MICRLDPWTTGLFVLLVSGVVVLVGINRPLQAIAGFGVVALGWPAYTMFASARRKRRTATTPR